MHDSTDVYAASEQTPVRRRKGVIAVEFTAEYGFGCSQCSWSYLSTSKALDKGG